MDATVEVEDKITAERSRASSENFPSPPPTEPKKLSPFVAVLTMQSSIGAIVVVLTFVSGANAAFYEVTCGTVSPFSSSSRIHAARRESNLLTSPPPTPSATRLVSQPTDTVRMVHAYPHFDPMTQVALSRPIIVQ